MKQRLGDILLAQGALDALQLQAALAYQRTWGVPLGQVVVDQRFCTAGQVLQALAAQTGLPAVDLDTVPLDLALARLVPVRVAEAHRVVPLRLEGPRDTLLVVAIAAPATLTSLDTVKSVSGKGRVTPHLATDAAVQRAIRRLYYPEHALVSPSAMTMAPISLPEADVDAPFEVESWTAGVASAQPEPRLPPPGSPGATLVPFSVAPRPSGSMPSPFGPPQRPSGAMPSPFAPPQRSSGTMPSPFQSPPPQRPSGTMPSPFPAPQRPSGTMPSPFRPPPGAVPPPGARLSGSLPAVQGGAAQPAAPAGARMLIYGWGAEATAALLRSLAPEGLPVQVASTAEVLAADARAIVIAPLPSMEGLGRRVRAQLLVAGKAPEVDLARAQALGAKGFLAAPLDVDLLLRAVRRLRRVIDEELAAARP